MKKLLFILVLLVSTVIGTARSDIDVGIHNKPIVESICNHLYTVHEINNDNHSYMIFGTSSDIYGDVRCIGVDEKLEMVKYIETLLDIDLEQGWLTKLCQIYTYQDNRHEVCIINIVYDKNNNTGILTFSIKQFYPYKQISCVNIS